ncbi:sec1 family domain-containing protein 2-like isoform X2 [Tubulanus polymorphus]
MHIYSKQGSFDGDEKEIFYQLEERLLEWMGNMNYTSEVVHIPFNVAPITPDLFILPDYTDMFPLMPSDCKSIELQFNLGKTAKAERKEMASLKDVEFFHLPKQLKLQYKLLASLLNSLMDVYNVRDECYSIGHTSRIIAMELANHAAGRNRRKASTNRASIILMDRSLDIAGCASHHSDNILDKIINILPRLPPHNIDISVNMAPLCHLPSECVDDVMVPGCLSHPREPKATNLLQNLMCAKQKEGLMGVNRLLVETAQTEEVPIKLSGKPGRVSLDQILSHIDLFKNDIDALTNNSGVLQVALAVVKALKNPDCTKWDSLLGVERLLLQNMGDEDCPSAASQIVQLIDGQLRKKESEYIVEDYILLLLFVFSLIGDDCIHGSLEERKLKDSLVNMITEAESLPQYIDEFMGFEKSEENVSGLVENLFTKLKDIGNSRNELKTLRDIYDAGSVTMPASYKPLIKQALDEIFSPAKPEMPDIDYRSTGLKDLLKTGFSLFMSVSKPRPNDNPLLIVFVLGGTTPAEVKLIKDTVSSYKTNTQVLVGSTSLLKSTDMIETLLLKDHMNPEISL